MTTPEQPQERRRVPFLVTAESGSRLEALLASYEAAKAAAAEAKARFDAITDGIKDELARGCPEGTTSVRLSGAPGMPRLAMAWQAPWRFQSKDFAKDYPYLYVKYSRQGGHWILSEAE